MGPIAGNDEQVSGARCRVRSRVYSIVGGRLSTRLGRVETAMKREKGWGNKMNTV
jgi:hypothetical protein